MNTKHCVINIGEKKNSIQTSTKKLQENTLHSLKLSLVHWSKFLMAKHVASSHGNTH